MPDKMDINAVREAALTATDFTMARIFATIYLGDAIREATGDIGPAIKDAGNALAVETGGVATALSDMSREMVR